jgi:cyanophycin synthetase
VDIAVLETARGGMLREGLAFQSCNIGIVTNVSEDHLGIDEIDTLEDLRRVKRIIPESVLPEGQCILNADDPGCVKMAEYTNAQVIYFSLNADNPVILEAFNKGMTVWYQEKGYMTCRHKGVTTRLILASSIPIAMNGFAQHNIANALAALAAAHAAGKSFKQLREGIMTFQLTFEHNRGRLNVFRQSDRTIFVDYAHNPAGMLAVLQSVTAFPRKRLITVASMPGDRQNIAIKQSVRIIAAFTDVLVIKEDEDLRGRQPREVAQMMRDEALVAGLPPSWLPIVPDESESYRTAWNMSEPGDILLYLYDNFEKIESFLEEITSIRLPDHAAALLQENGRNEWSQDFPWTHEEPLRKAGVSAP